MRGNDRLAVSFALVFGVAAFLLSVAAGHPLRANLLAGAIGLALGAALMIMLRWRP